MLVMFYLAETGKPEVIATAPIFPNTPTSFESRVSSMPDANTHAVGFWTDCLLLDGSQLN
ncbi:hypothetical protein RI103_33525 [Paraburkholderia sp. FT54]|uniref:hypothetical protein n=1 Tax=Paraburkholderia sp. FT54 TaxID=3074437 RepID=UPI0028778B0B|nr:hypothetical protein [Paraburkholderia sp. FT54]WNC94848.1 hypothetical protein RI103_33525 [Paraburkholderia sp. FT54]